MMTITLELPQELEQELSVEAQKINLSLADYILHLITIRQVLNNRPKTGAELVNYWQKEGLIEMLIKNIDYFKSKPQEPPKTTILLDNGYHPETIRIELEKVYPEIMRKIEFELSPKPSKAEKQAQGKSGFVPVKARWVIERSNSWMERCKSLVKNFERTLDHATTKLNLCFIRLMLKRLAIA